MSDVFYYTLYHVFPCTKRLRGVLSAIIPGNFIRSAPQELWILTIIPALNETCTSYGAKFLETTTGYLLNSSIPSRRVHPPKESRTSPCGRWTSPSARNGALWSVRRYENHVLDAVVLLDLHNQDLFIDIGHSPVGYVDWILHQFSRVSG